ncbi:MAG: hypothetical protein EYX74_01000 [Desulfobulbaceae bacterium]|nr:MAG: hypothetical protein EYX74_01000 [Desulfobulbaceae bacterium]
MNDVTEKILLFLGGAAMGSLAFIALSKKDPADLRPALVGLTAGALELRDKAAGILQRTQEDVSDFFAEVEHARATKAEGRDVEAETATSTAAKADTDPKVATAQKTGGKK